MNQPPATSPKDASSATPGPVRKSTMRTIGMTRNIGTRTMIGMTYDSGRDWTEEEYYDDREDEYWQEKYPDEYGEGKKSGG
eukprot:2498304-Pyramimonas_sp.AAC.1